MSEKPALIIPDEPQTYGEARIARLPAQHPTPVVVSESGAMLAVIERAARDPSVDPGKMERLFAMRKDLEQEAARKAFNAAVAAAKSSIGPIIKNKRVGYESKRTGDRTDYRYEDFAAVARAVDGPLSENGLSYRFRTAQDGASVIVTCILAHSDGHSEETTLRGAVDTSGQKNAIQGIGSAVTYLQRYTLKAALGLSASEADNDGAGTSAADDRTLSEEQLAEVEQMIADRGIDRQKLLEYLKIESLESVLASRFEDLKGVIKRGRGNKDQNNG